LRGSTGEAVRRRALTVMSRSDSTVMSPLKLSAVMSISPPIVTLPPPSIENSSPCPNPLAMPNMGPVI
jgi:hypothetical protein